MHSLHPFGDYPYLVFFYVCPAFVSLVVESEFGFREEV